MRSAVVSLLLLSLLTFVLGLGRQAISDGDEGYYAEAAREMVESGDWLTPHFNYEQRWQKPILYYWATAATFAIAGVSDGGARAFAAASGIALVFLTYAIGRRLRFTPDAAWLGAAIVATCYGYFALARLALPDLPLALFVTGTIFLWLERRPALAGAAAGLGFLDKGPLAILLPALVLLPMAWRDRRTTSDDAMPPVALDVRTFVTAGLTFLVVAVPWYAAMVNAHGVAYLRSFFIGDNLERFATDRFNAPRALWFYVPVLVGGIFPWSAFLLVLPWRRAGALLQKRSRLSFVEWRLVIWTIAPLLFFTASIGKQPRYILPVLPPLALLLAASIAKRLPSSSGTPTDTRGLAVATWTTGLIYLVLAALLIRARPVLINAHPTLTLAAAVTLVVSALLLMATVAMQRWRALPARMAGTAALLLLGVQFGALAGVRPEAVETVAGLVRTNLREGDTLATYETLERNLAFYTGRHHMDLFDDRQALDLLESDTRVLLVARAEDVARLQSRTEVPLQALGSVNYLDPGTIRLSTLLMPSPRRDVADLMLVSNR